MKHAKVAHSDLDALAKSVAEAMEIPITIEPYEDGRFSVVYGISCVGPFNGAQTELYLTGLLHGSFAKSSYETFLKLRAK